MRPSPTRPRSRGARNKVVRGPKSRRDVGESGSSHDRGDPATTTGLFPSRDFPVRRAENRRRTRRRIGVWGHSRPRLEPSIRLPPPEKSRAASSSPGSIGERPRRAFSTVAVPSRRLGDRGSRPNSGGIPPFATRPKMVPRSALRARLGTAKVRPPWGRSRLDRWIWAGVPCIGNPASRGPKEKWKISW